MNVGFSWQMTHPTPAFSQGNLVLSNQDSRYRKYLAHFMYSNVFNSLYGTLNEFRGILVQLVGAPTTMIFNIVMPARVFFYSINIFSSLPWNAPGGFLNTGRIFPPLEWQTGVFQAFLSRRLLFPLLKPNMETRNRKERFFTAGRDSSSFFLS